MPHLHFRRTPYKSGGRQAVARVQYVMREEKQERHADNAVRHITRDGLPDREDLLYKNSRNLPAWAAGDPVTYFRTAEQEEWALGIGFEEWKVTLPHELTARQNMALMRDLVVTIAGDRLPITYAMHAPDTLAGTKKQPHLHLLISGRQHDGIPRTQAQHFKKYNRDHPERGGAPKDPALYHVHAVKAWRVTITDVVNLHLERAGCVGRVHPDRLEDRGFERTPEPKLRPSESREYREQGTVSARMGEVLAIRKQRVTGEKIEQADAQAYWQERKDELGLVHGMTPAEQLAVIREARAQRRDHAPARTVPHDQGNDLDTRWPLPLLGNTQSRIYHTPRHPNYGDVSPRHQVRFWTEREARDAGYRRARNDELGVDGRPLTDAEWIARHPHGALPPASASRPEDLLAALAAQLDAMRDEPGARGHRVRLWDREAGLGF